MLSRNRLYLSDLATAEAKENIQKYFRKSLLPKAFLIIPRALCVTATLQAKGVPRHKTKSFIQLQLTRLAPFSDYGVFAFRSGDLIHLWFWENQKIRAACQSLSDHYDQLDFLPESVCFPKEQNGAVINACQQGYEVQLWKDGQFVDAAWWSDPVTTDTWKQWIDTSSMTDGARFAGVNWPQTLPPLRPRQANEAGQRLGSPWAQNIFGARWYETIVQNINPVSLVFAGATVLAGYAAFVGAEWLSYNSALARTEQNIAQLSQQTDPVNDARFKALDLQRWVRQVSSLQSNQNITALLNDLQPLLQQQDAALREFEYVNGELRLIIVPINTELNMLAATQALEAFPLLSKVRLLPDSDTKTMRFSASVKAVAPQVQGKP